MTWSMRRSKGAMPVVGSQRPKSPGVVDVEGPPDTPRRRPGCTHVRPSRASRGAGADFGASTRARSLLQPGQALLEKPLAPLAHHTFRRVESEAAISSLDSPRAASRIILARVT